MKLIPSSATESLRQQLEEAHRRLAAEMAAEIATAIEEDQAEYLAATGQVLPTTLDDMDEIIIQARVVGFTAAESEAGEYTLAAIHRQAIAAKILRDQRVEDDASSRPAMPSPTAKTAGDPKPSTGEEHSVDGLLLKARKKLATKKFSGNATRADEELRILGWTALADAIAELTGESICEKTLYRHRNKSAILKTYSPFQPRRGGKSKARRSTTAAIDLAGGAGQLVTVSRHSRLLMQEPDPAQDPRSDEQRKQDDSEAQWIEQGRPGTCSSKACRDENPTRFRNGRAWCDDCYSETFEGKTPDVIGIRPR